MNKRITLISNFDAESISKIQEKLKVIKNINLCKVPFGKNIINREKADTLPFHFTFCAWDINLEKKILISLAKIKFRSFQIKIVDVKIMSGKDNSYVLYFSIDDNEYLKKLQKEIYNINPASKYNPDNFKFHITIHIDKDYNNIINIKNY